MRNRTIKLEVELVVEADYTMNVKQAINHARDSLRLCSWAGVAPKGKYRAMVRKTRVLSDEKTRREEHGT